jgi:hypothetical protein
MGVIDCAGDCAGTEEEFKKFLEVNRRTPLRRNRRNSIG